MALAYIGLGANLGEPALQLQRAIEALRASPGLTVRAESSFYRTDPLGPPGQADYCNAVVLIETACSPDEVLQRLVAIEDALGKRRGGPKWGSRRIDLDLLLYDQMRIDRSDLQVPHPGITSRNFVLVPLLELAPDLMLPGLGMARDFLDQVGMDGIDRWSR